MYRIQMYKIQMYRISECVRGEASLDRSKLSSAIHLWSDASDESEDTYGDRQVDYGTPSRNIRLRPYKPTGTFTFCSDTYCALPRYATHMVSHRLVAPRISAAISSWSAPYIDLVMIFLVSLNN